MINFSSLHTQISSSSKWLKKCEGVIIYGGHKCSTVIMIRKLRDWSLRIIITLKLLQFSSLPIIEFLCFSVVLKNWKFLTYNIKLNYIFHIRHENDYQNIVAFSIMKNWSYSALWIRVISFILLLPIIRLINILSVFYIERNKNLVFFLIVLLG